MEKKEQVMEKLFFVMIISAANYNPEDPQFLHNSNYPKAMGVDPRYGTSKSAYMLQSN
jgi:hypothetical protein